MRVALVHETAAPSLGGAETSTLEMSEALQRAGHHVTLVTRGSESDAGDEILECGICIHRVPVGSQTRAGRAIGFVQGADAFCLGEGFDIIHAVTPCLSANVYQPRGGTYPETIRRNLALEPTFLHRWIKRIDRRLNMRQRFLTLLERDLLKVQRPPFVACLSDYVSRQVAADYGVPDERRQVIYNGVEPRILPQGEVEAVRARIRSVYGIPADAPLVLFVAHNPKLKGLRELLSAWPHVLSRGEAEIPHLLVVGRGKQRRLKLTETTAKSVHFAEPVAEMEALYAAGDMLAHPTWYDPFSRVVLEAVGSGIPAVTTSWNGAAEVLTDNVHGIVIHDPSDRNALADAIYRCLNEPIRSACAAAAADFRAQFSMDQHAIGLTSLYERVLNS